MIFVIIGSRMFQFDRLLKEIDMLVEQGVIKDTLFAQTGSSMYAPRNFEYSNFLNHDKFNDYINKSDIIITHAGVGSIITSLKAGKKVIAVARLKRYDEHIDDHQLEIVRKFSEMGMIIGLEDVSQLENTMRNLDSIKTKPYKANTSRIINIIEDFINPN